MFKKGDLKSNLLGILILLVGVIVGVVLVRQTQVFKNKAKEISAEKYMICHKTGDPKLSWEQITVNADELPLYLNNGDIFGECPEDLNN